jgi:hypothetical protein
MKIKEDHIIAALVVLIIFVIWSKFTLSSGYAVGQAGTAQTIPTISIPGKDINMSNWAPSSTNSYTTITNDSGVTLGVAISTGTTTDNKLGPGDLNRQGWAAGTGFSLSGITAAQITSFNSGTATCTVNNTNFQFAGFRKQLQPGGGGTVWYLFTNTGNLPTGSSYLQDQDAKVLLTVGTLNIPQFVIYLKSAISPFPDTGCAYVVTNTGACSATTCTSTGGTAIQTLKLVKLATGTAPCLASDQTTDLSQITTTSTIGNTGVNSVTLTATNATNGATSVAGLSSGGAFTKTAAVGTQCYYATQCFPAGCSGGTSGFLANSGTVVTIAGGSPGTSGTTDGVGVNGSLITNASVPTFTAPTYICASGTAATVSNVVVAGGVSSTTLTVRDMFKETIDKPPQWQVVSRSITVAAGCTVSGIAIDCQTPPTLYIADSTNNKIYKTPSFNTSSPTTATWTISSGTYGTVAGIWCDATTSATNLAGAYIYALTTTTKNLLVIPVATATSTVTDSVMMVIPLGGATTPGQLAISGTTCYFTDSNKVYKFTVPTFSVGTKASVTPTQWGGGGSGLGATGASGTGNLTTTGQMTVDSNGNLYIANSGNHGIVKLDTGGNIYPYLGPPVAPGSSGASASGSADTGGSTGAAYPGGGASFNGPLGLTIAPDGLTFFVADTGNNNIRIVT